MKRIGAMAVVMVMLAAGAAMAGEIHDAAQKGDLDQVKALVEKDPKLVNEKNENGGSPLLIAAADGDLAICKFLVENGADLQAKNKHGLTVLHFAASHGHKDVCELLLARGADLEAKDDQGMTPLHWAAFKQFPEVCDFLISKGADVNAADDHGWTALHHAALHKDDIKTARLLLDKGANLNATDGEGKTPLYHAAGTGKKTITGLLIEKGADINARDKEGNTPLSSAAAQPDFDNYETIKLLVDKGADPNLGVKPGRTSPLHIAASHNDLALAKLLVEKGADVNLPSEDGRTPLYAAADKSANDVIKFLAEKGADMNARSKAGWAPIDITQDRETIELLKSLSAKDDPAKRARYFGLIHQAEAEDSLNSISVAQTIYHSKNESFSSSFKNFEKPPQGNTRYALFMADDVIQPSIGGPYQLPDGVKAEVTADSYTIVAVSNLDDDDTLDVWVKTVRLHADNDFKCLSNDLEK